MFRKTWVLIFPLISAIFLSACSGGGTGPTVAEFTGTNNQKVKVSLAEFERAYTKTSGGIENAKKDDREKLKNFLEVYTNFKMKLQDGTERGFDKDTALTKELEDYLRQVGQDRKSVV